MKFGTGDMSAASACSELSRFVPLGSSDWFHSLLGTSERWKSQSFVG
jgi:hypothetical protein